MFNLKLEEKSYKMSFKALPVKIQRSKNRQGGAQCAPPLLHPPGQLGLNTYQLKYVNNVYIKNFCTDA